MKKLRNLFVLMFTFFVMFTAVGCGNDISLVLKHEINKIDYAIGEEIDLTGGELILKIGNDKYAVEFSQCQISDVDTSTAGRKEVKITYTYKEKDYTASFFINVTASGTENPDPEGPTGQIAPTQLLFENVGSTTITITAQTGCEYSKDNGTTWQDSNVFEGLTPNTAYTFAIRKKAVLSYPCSEKFSRNVTTIKEAQTAPTTIETTVLTASEITITAQEGCEYSCIRYFGVENNNEVWSDSPNFERLLPGQRYQLSIRKKETETKSASEKFIKQVQTLKLEQSIPNQIQATVTANKITIEAQTGCEYSCIRYYDIENNNEIWLTNPVFVRRMPGVKYQLSIRKAETDSHYASEKVIKIVTTPKINPSNITSMDYVATTNSITITPQEGCEYSKDNGTTWQDGNVFEGLTLNTTYQMAIRKKETSTFYASIPYVLEIKTLKNTVSAPTTIPEVLNVATRSITVSVVDGLEYLVDTNTLEQTEIENGTWSTTGIFTSLKPNTNYFIYSRYKETQNDYASAPSNAATATTEALLEQIAPTAIEIDRITNVSIKIVAQEGCEYRIGGHGFWGDLTEFNNLNPDTEYTIYIRKKETATHAASSVYSRIIKTSLFGPIEA